MVNSFDISTLTEHQRNSLDDLKRRFEKFPDEYLHNENYLMHWIVARKFDVDKAEKMLLWHYRIRKANNMDDPAYKTCQLNPIMLNYYPHGVFKHDKEGHPVSYYTIGSIDSKGLVSNVKSSDIYRAIMYWQEERYWNCADASKLCGKNVQQATYIMDLKGLGTKHLWKCGLDTFQEILHLVEQHTPEIIYRLYIINAPAVFPIIYKIVKTVLDENTKRKIQIYGDDFKDALLEIIDLDQLPVHYGGTATGDNGDPDCKPYITYGDTVPLSLHKKFDEPTDMKVEEMRIKPGSQIIIPIDAPENSMIEWYIRSESSHDIFFSVYQNNIEDFSSMDENPDLEKLFMVVPYFRIYTLIVPETGNLKIKTTGRYYFQFDNTHSWLTSKTLKYAIKVSKDEKEKNGELEECNLNGHT